MKLCKLTRIFFYGLILFIIHDPLAFALKSDRDQPITIDSNTATYDENKEVSIYTGNVDLVQGTLRVKSDKLVVYLRNGRVEKMVATGKPARFRQIPSEGKEEMRGKSLKAEYYPNKELLILIDDAIVWQGNNTYASEIIKYDSKNAIVRAGEKATDTKRVRVILNPKEKTNSK